MTERASKIFQARQQKINEAFKRQRLDLDIEPLIGEANRLTEDLVDSEGWTELSQMGKSTLYAKGNERKVVNPDLEDLHFTAPDKPTGYNYHFVEVNEMITHETIYQAPADEIFPDDGRKTNGKDHKGNWGKHK